MPSETLDEPRLVLRIPDIGVVPLEDRFRVPGGTVTHRAKVAAPEGEDGFVAILACDTSLYRWFAWSEDERLDLIQPDDADVTCTKCQEVEARFLGAERATPGGGEDAHPEERGDYTGWASPECLDLIEEDCRRALDGEDVTPMMPNTVLGLVQEIRRLRESDPGGNKQ